MSASDWVASDPQGDGLKDKGESTYIVRRHNRLKEVIKMEEQRLDELLDGAKPELEDYKEFDTICEAIPDSTIWAMLNESPNMHPILKSVAMKHLSKKITTSPANPSMEEILTNLAHRYK